MATGHNIEKKEDEFIIRGENIIKREIFECDMGTHRELLASLQTSTRMQFTPLRVPPTNDLNGLIDHHFIGYRDEVYRIFTKINFFPLYGAHLTQWGLSTEEVEAGDYILQCSDYRRRDLSDLSREERELHEQTIYMDDEPLKWTPDSSAGIELYIMNTWTGNGLSSEPLLFVRDLSGQSYYTVRLPNVYDNAVICVGYNWAALRTANERRFLRKPLAQAEHGLLQIRDVPCNSDLYHRNLTKLFARWDKDGNQLSNLGPIHINARCALSNDSITQFMDWRAEPETMNFLEE